MNSIIISDVCDYQGYQVSVACRGTLGYINQDPLTSEPVLAMIAGVRLSIADMHAIISVMSDRTFEFALIKNCPPKGRVQSESPVECSRRELSAESENKPQRAAYRTPRKMDIVSNGRV